MHEEEGIIREFRLREGRTNDVYEPRIIGPSESTPIKTAGGGIPVYIPPVPPPLTPPDPRPVEIIQPTITPWTGVAYKPDTGRESRHDLFLQSHPEGVYPSGPGEAKTTATAPAKNFLDRFFDWLNNLLSGR